MESASRLRSFKAEITLGIIVLILIPLLNTFGVLSDYYMNLFGKYLSLAIFALGVDLLWGYMGILGLGQAVFFGLGAYSLGMHMMLESSGKGVYGEPVPDFMIWNRVFELPLFWKPYRYFPFALVSALLLPALIATAIGLLTFRRKVGGTYFAILTQVMAFAIWLMFNRNEMKLGGTNGLTDFKTLLGFPLSGPRTMHGLYFITAVFLVVVFWGCRKLARSKAGLVMMAIRDQEQRVRFLGYPVTSYKIFVFALSATLAGLGGALYVPQVGIITPSQIGVMPSLEVVIWVAAGGRGTLLGALLGAVGVNAARSVLTAKYPQWWLVILGTFFVAIVLFFPEGLVGLPKQFRRWGRGISRSLGGPHARNTESTQGGNGPSSPQAPTGMVSSTSTPSDSIKVR